MFSFKYKKEKSASQGTIYRPVAEVVIENNKIKIEAGMYIDSGADISMVPLSIGRALGFSETTDKIFEMKGIAGEAVPYMIKTVNLVFPGYKFKARIGWALIEEIPILLGRLDVFPRFKVIFDESAKTVTFVPKIEYSKYLNNKV